MNFHIFALTFKGLSITERRPAQIHKQRNISVWHGVSNSFLAIKVGFCCWWLSFLTLNSIYISILGFLGINLYSQCHILIFIWSHNSPDNRSIVGMHFHGPFFSIYHPCSHMPKTSRQEAMFWDSLTRPGTASSSVLTIVSCASCIKLFYKNLY